MEKLVYTVQEVSEMLGISQSYTYALLKNGTIPSIKLGSKKIISKEKFNKWLSEQ